MRFEYMFYVQDSVKKTRTESLESKCGYVGVSKKKHTYLIAKLLYFMKDFVEVFIKLFQVQNCCGISLLQVQPNRHGIGLLQRNNEKSYMTYY